MYQNIINCDKINNNLKMMVQSLTLKNKGLKAKEASLEQRNKDLNSTNKELALQIEKKDDELHKLIGGSRKLSNVCSKCKRVHHAISVEEEINVEVTLISTIFLLKLPLLVLV